ncbi:hypothetical protein TSOC_007416 [Tetrabaena socialis]|uniref:Uncharacterized protein n=1 Tax=Tetrabaena socialis TaxID=47790 RepID=A0A2J8A169_9CHLO|nr:hypothetical protein TSOC_007416 [Tetrabaena socialis]|eukprot:PNH06238.1 hypothetical protein TSOC_007416 [Tetrabaena socialis]
MASSLQSLPLKSRPSAIHAPKKPSYMLPHVGQPTQRQHSGSVGNVRDPQEVIGKPHPAVNMARGNLTPLPR